MLDAAQIAPEQLAALGESELRELATRLLARIERHTHEIDWRDAKLEKLAYEIAHLRRMKFSARSEQLNAQQKALFDESVDADIAALEAELEDLKAPVEGVVTTYDKPFTKTDHDAITANIPVFGEVKGARVVYANPDDMKNAAKVRLKDAAANAALVK